MNIFKVKFWLIFILAIFLIVTMVGCDTMTVDDKEPKLVEKDFILEPLTVEYGTKWNEVIEELPDTVEIEFKNGETTEAAIEWTEPDNYDPEPEEDTTYEIGGKASAEYEDVVYDNINVEIELTIGGKAGNPDSIAAANTTVTAGTGGTLEVTVTDEYGNELEGETVEVVDDDGLDGIDTGDIAKTGTDGVAVFFFHEVNANDYNVDFEANDITDTATVTIKPGPPDENKSYIGTAETLNTEVLNYTENQSHTFTITVLDEHGNAIENATVTINTVTINLDYTDSNFTFTLSDGTASKTITDADYASSSTEDQDVAVNLQLTAADTDANGKVDVEITAEDGYYDPTIGFDDVTLAVIRVSVEGGITHAGIDLRNEGYKYFWVN